MKKEKELRVALSKFIAAKKKMESMSKGRYNSVHIDYATYVSGDDRIECSVYRDNVGLGTGRTWEEAFEKFEIRRQEKAGG